MYWVKLEVWKKNPGVYQYPEFVVNTNKPGIRNMLKLIKDKYDLSGVQFIKVYDKKKIKEDEAIWIPEYLNSLLVLHNE